MAQTPPDSPAPPDILTNPFQRVQAPTPQMNDVRRSSLVPARIDHDTTGSEPSLHCIMPPSHEGSASQAWPNNLGPPQLTSGTYVTGATTPRLRIENKRRRREQQLTQQLQTWWTRHTGLIRVPRRPPDPVGYRNRMCPRGLALEHPAAPLLLKYAMTGCPVDTGPHWTSTQLAQAIDYGSHVSATTPEAITQLGQELREKEALRQVRLVPWASIRDDPPRELKISPIAMVPHKSRTYRVILDLSFACRDASGNKSRSVNSTTRKTAPAASIDQLGQALMRIIYAFATAPANQPIFMAKWDIKDGFWRLDCAPGKEWNFAYLLPSSTAALTLVVPSALQMGWIESPAYFCAASETSRDVAASYANTPLGSIPSHMFLADTTTTPRYLLLPTTPAPESPFDYLIEVYMDDFIGLALAQTRQQLDHLASAIMTGIHDVFPPSPTSADDPISHKKRLAGDAAWDVTKDILGITFDGDSKTLWLAEEKRDSIIQTLRTWLRASTRPTGIPFIEFQSTMSKVRHAFLTIPSGSGLLSPFYALLASQPKTVYLAQNPDLAQSVRDCLFFLHDSVSKPTLCKNLIPDLPDFVGITDASGHGCGGVIIGERLGVPPTVFRLAWPLAIRHSIVSSTNPSGTITNSDLEMAGLLLLWLVMEAVCPTLTNAHVALISDNTPTVHWVQRMASKQSRIAMHLVRALAFRLQARRCSPLTPLHIAGVDNALTDIPSRSFGSEPRWACATDHDLLTMFTSLFPLPHQASWTVFVPSKRISMRLTSVLQMTSTDMDVWRRLPPLGQSIGPIGQPTLHLWDWTHTFKRQSSPTDPARSRDSPPESAPDTTDEATKLQLRRLLALSQPLARRSPWPQDATPRN